MTKKSPTGMINYFSLIPSRKIGTGTVRNLKLETDETSSTKQF